jgi:hypothetical protein
MLGILGIQGRPWIRALIGAALAIWGAGEGVWRLVGGDAGRGGRR